MTAAAEMPEDIRDTAYGIVDRINYVMPDPAAVRDDIERAILAERQRDQWQPIHTAPKDGTLIDLWGVNHLHPKKTGRRVTDVTWGPVRDWMGRERADWQHGMAEDFEPTHWQPLPAAPKGGVE